MKNSDINEIIFIEKEKLVPETKHSQQQLIHKYLNDDNTTVAIMKEYKCLILENVTKLIDKSEYLDIKSV